MVKNNIIAKNGRSNQVDTYLLANLMLNMFSIIVHRIVGEGVALGIVNERENCEMYD